MEASLKNAMETRHSVRQYLDKPIPKAVCEALQAEVNRCNQEGNLHIQLILHEPKAFDCFLSRYGKFSGVSNYLALIGPKSSHLDTDCGFYGERLALKAQTLGLNSCWVAMSYRKVPGTFICQTGEKLMVVIALGYGKTQGVPHKSKSIEQVSNVSDQTPDWFRDGVAAALLAPTAMNQQKFFFTYENGTVTAKAGRGPYTKLDLGIAKYHFQLGADRAF
ncbi:MAG: nitroreductase family protein [Oscillospiraceae bacterium]|nr:nitroreductase family protein [Oscillospiraceae bacterium]